MGTTAQKLQNIANVKSALAGIITAKGETVPAKFADYPAKLQSVDYLQCFTSEGFTGDVRSNITNLAAYGLYNFKCSGSLYLPSLTAAGEKAFEYASVGGGSGEIHVESLESVSGQFALADTSVAIIHADSLMTTSSNAPRLLNRSTAKTAYVGWGKVNASQFMKLCSTGSGSTSYMFNSCSSLTTLYLGRINAGSSVGSGTNNWVSTKLSTIYCGSDSPDTLLSVCGSGWGFPSAYHPAIYCWCKELSNWYKFTWNGSAYTYELMTDTSGMPEIPTGA